MIEFTRIKNDINGNPRYVCHYLNLLSQDEINNQFGKWTKLASMYNVAVKRAHKLGGRKYHTKSYGGGIVFQSYNIRELEKDILELVERES
jgi:hypothetical protein